MSHPGVPCGARAASHPVWGSRMGMGMEMGMRMGLVPSWALIFPPGRRSWRWLLPGLACGSSGSAGVNPRKPLGSRRCCGALPGGRGLLGLPGTGIPRESRYLQCHIVCL